jgi:RNA polymerase sigma-70 factor (ECF subfamily)
LSDRERAREVRGEPREAARPHEADWRLARQALAGSPAARRQFAELMRCVPKFLVLIHARSGLRLRDQDLEDVVQEALAQIWRRLDTYEGRASLQTWAYRFCQRTLSTHRRMQQRRTDRILPAGPVDAPEPAPRGDYGWVHEALGKVREADARILRHRHFDGLSFAEIAARLSISESGAKAGYRRGLERLRDLLGRQVAEGGL